MFIAQNCNVQFHIKMLKKNDGLTNTHKIWKPLLCSPRKKRSHTNPYLTKVKQTERTFDERFICYLLLLLLQRKENKNKYLLRN